MPDVQMPDVQNYEPPPRETAEYETPVNHPVGARQPTSVKLLNGLVTRQAEMPFSEGRSCMVWIGRLSNRGGENGSGEEIGKEGASTKKVSINLAISIPLMQFSAGGFESA